MPLGYFSKCQIKSINVLSKPKPEPKTYVFWGKTSVPYLPSEPNEPNERLCFHQMNQINTYSKNERFFSTNEFISFILWTIDKLGQNPNPSPRRSNSTQKPNKTQWLLFFGAKNQITKVDPINIYIVKVLWTYYFCAHSPSIPKAGKRFREWRARAHLKGNAHPLPHALLLSWALFTL